MKKYYFFCLVATILSGSAANAQDAPSLRTQAVEATRKLAQQISLDDARTSKVKNLTYERLTQESELKQTYSIDPAMLQSKMAVVEKEYAEKLKGVLTEAQYQRYLTIPAAPAPVTAALPSAQPTPVHEATPVSKPTAQPKANPAPTKKAAAPAHAGTLTATRH